MKRAAATGREGGSGGGSGGGEGSGVESGGGGGSGGCDILPLGTVQVVSYVRGDGTVQGSERRT